MGRKSSTRKEIIILRWEGYSQVRIRIGLNQDLFLGHLPTHHHTPVFLGVLPFHYFNFAVVKNDKILLVT